MNAITRLGKEVNVVTRLSFSGKQFLNTLTLRITIYLVKEGKARQLESISKYRWVNYLQLQENVSCFRKNCSHHRKGETFHLLLNLSCAPHITHLLITEKQQIFSWKDCFHPDFCSIFILQSNICILMKTFIDK